MARSMTKTRMTCAGDTVGEVEVHGMCGGAFCWHYRIEAVADGVTTLVRVEPRSVRDENGTRSTRYEVAP